MYWTAVHFGMLLLLGISDGPVFGTHHILAGGYTALTDNDIPSLVIIAATLISMVGLVFIALLFGHSVFLVQRFEKNS